MDRFKHRCFHIQDWPLSHLIYSFTPGGRISVRKMLKKYKYKIAEEDKYDDCVGLDPFLNISLREIGFKFDVIKKSDNSNL